MQGVGRVLVACNLFAVACGARVPQPGRGPAAFDEGYLPGAGGTRLFYRTVGAGDPTIVVIHGGPGGTLNSLFPDLKPLAARHRVIYYDQRGGGRSSLPEDPKDLDARWFVEDLEAVRRHFGLERLNILAHSFGPLIAARYAEAYPPHVGRMVFMGAIGPRAADAGAFAMEQFARMDDATRKRSMALVRELQGGTSPDPIALCLEYEALEREMATRRRETTSQEATSCDGPPGAVRYAFAQTSRVTFESFGEWDFTARLRTLTAPLLVVYGDRDPSPRSAHEAWVRSVRAARLLVVPGAGHGPHVDRPGVFFPSVEAFFDGSWPKGAVPVP